MTYFWGKGDPLIVQTNEYGLPQLLVWDGRKHTVLWVANRWIVDDFWWGERVWRDYFKLTTDSGMLLTIFRELLTDTWFVQRLYD